MLAFISGSLKTGPMISIGVVDDREEWRGSIKVRMEQVLTLSGIGGVNIVAIEPLPNVGDYSHWIQSEGICALLIDELLDDRPLRSSGASCGYEGHDMAETLRRRSDQIPIFVVTAVSSNSDLEQNPGLFDTVLEKGEFEERIEGYLQRILRSAHRYSIETQAQYTELSEVSQRVALGTATKQDENRLKALQEILQLRVNSEELVTRSAMLVELQDKLAALEVAMANAKKFLA